MIFPQYVRYLLSSLEKLSIDSGDCAYFFPVLYNKGWFHNSHVKMRKTLIFPMSLNSENDQTPNQHDTNVVSYIKLNSFMGIGQ